METKYFPRCKTEKPVGEFYKNKATSSGLSGYCVLCHNQVVRERQWTKRLEMFAYLGGECLHCGFDADPRGFVIDHVDGDGKASGVWPRSIKELQNRPGKYQLLCATCNQIKRFENQEHGQRNIQREVPTKKLRGIGNGNGSGQRAGLAKARTLEHQAAAVVKMQEAWKDPEKRAAAIEKLRKNATGRKLVDGHWVQPVG